MTSLEKLNELLEEKKKIEKSIENFSKNNKKTVLEELVAEVSSVLQSVDFECIYVTCAYPYAFYDDSVDTVSNKQNVEVDWDGTSALFTSQIPNVDFDQKITLIMQALGQSYFDVLTFLMTDSYLLINKDGSYKNEALPESHFGCW